MINEALFGGELAGVVVADEVEDAVAEEEEEERRWARGSLMLGSR